MSRQSDFKNRDRGSMLRVVVAKTWNLSCHKDMINDQYNSLYQGVQGINSESNESYRLLQSIEESTVITTINLISDSTKMSNKLKNIAYNLRCL